MSPLLAALLVLIVVLVAAVAWAVAARRVGEGQRAANQVVPGTATAAPAAWAGAHTPEARLHRRLRDAVAAAAVTAGGDAIGTFDVRATLEQQALALDQRLVAAAALPETTRSAAVAQVAVAVESLEAAVAALVASLATGSDTAAQDEVAERLRALEAARAELETPHTDPPTS